MQTFLPMLSLNLRRRLTDGFAVGYSIVFPAVMIGLLGWIGKRFFGGEVSGFQYYTIVIIPFCTIMAVVTAAYAGKDDAYAKTAQRVLASPVSQGAIVTAKILSETLVFTGCAMLVLMVSALLCHLTIWDHLLRLCLFYLGISYVTAAIGTWIGLGMKNFLRIKNIISIPISIAAFAGGCFFKVGSLQESLHLLVLCSPLTWLNRSVFLLLYDDQSFLMNQCIVICLILGTIFYGIAIASFRKEEYDNGELPSYEK